jgi:hypothetical protein
MLKRYMRLLAALPLACAAQAFAQASDPTIVSAVLPSSSHEMSGADQPACSCTIIPELTPVILEIMAPVGSKISKTGDSFPIRLAAPIVIDGKEWVPAGVTGVGEVVHAKKSGGMGAAGELVLAARYLEVDGRRLPLRSLNLAAAGKSGIAAVNAVNVGSAVSPVPIGLIGFFISGGQMTVPQGTIVPAKTRENFALPAQAGATPVAAETAASTQGATQ